MELTSAIAYIRNWRNQQNLESLSPSDEREAAVKLIAQKAYNLPEKVADFDGSYYLIEGVYQKPVKMNESIDLVVVTIPTTGGQNPEYPWNPSDKSEFWCERLGFFCKLTGDLNVDGTYYVVKVGEGYFRSYPVKGFELVPKSQAPSNAPVTDLLPVNRATWSEIKNFLVDKFIPSYPWTKRGEKAPVEVRADMDAAAKSKNKGLAKLIEDERLSSRGTFEGRENFTMRMTALHESFPWTEFAQMLDFCQ